MEITIVRYWIDKDLKVTCLRRSTLHAPFACPYKFKLLSHDWHFKTLNVPLSVPWRNTGSHSSWPERSMPCLRRMLLRQYRIRIETRVQSLQRGYSGWVRWPRWQFQFSFLNLLYDRVYIASLFVRVSFHSLDFVATIWLFLQDDKSNFLSR